MPHLCPRLLYVLDSMHVIEGLSLDRDLVSLLPFRLAYYFRFALSKMQCCSIMLFCCRRHLLPSLAVLFNCIILSVLSLTYSMSHRPRMGFVVWWRVLCPSGTKPQTRPISATPTFRHYRRAFLQFSIRDASILDCLRLTTNFFHITFRRAERLGDDCRL